MEEVYPLTKNSTRDHVFKRVENIFSFIFTMSLSIELRELKLNICTEIFLVFCRLSQILFLPALKIQIQIVFISRTDFRRSDGSRKMREPRDPTDMLKPQTTPTKLFNFIFIFYFNVHKFIDV